MSTTILALIVALISVVTPAIPAIKKAFGPGKPIVNGQIGFVSSYGDKYSVTLLLANSGDMDAILARVMWCDDDGKQKCDWKQFEMDVTQLDDDHLIIGAGGVRVLSGFIPRYEHSLSVWVEYFDAGGAVSNVELPPYEKAVLH